MNSIARTFSRRACKKIKLHGTDISYKKHNFDARYKAYKATETAAASV